MAAVLAVLEQRDGALKKVSAEVLGAAGQLASMSGGTVEAIAVGPANLEAELGSLAAAKCHLVADDGLVLYQPDLYAAAVAQQASAGDYSAILVSATAMGKDLAPRIAARLKCALVADVTAFGGDDKTFVRPTYAGKAVATVKVNADTAVVSIRPNAFAAAEAGSAEVSVGGAPDADQRVTTVEIKAPESKSLDVSEAAIVVAGGRGLKEPENFKLIEDLAAAFGGEAAVGASRAVVDAGWRPHSEQVGQTGKVVSPNLYFAVGISGAIQHLAGMRTSKVIVAINRDPDAPIFKVSDYGIVGDLFDIVPVLTEEIGKIKAG